MRGVLRRAPADVPYEDPIPVPAPVYRAPLPRSRVVDGPYDIIVDGCVVGFRMLVQGADVTQHAGAIAAQAPEIAALYRTVVEGVTVTPAAEARYGHGAAWVEVLDSWFVTRRARDRKDRMASRNPYPGSTLDVTRGTVSVGVCVDDGADALWQLWVPGQGARHGWGVGSTGSGKSVGISGLLASACSAGLVVPVIADLQGGVSMPEWEDATPFYATDPDGACLMMRRLVREMERRVAFMRGLDKRDPRKVVLDPSPEWPLILAVFDEAPVLTRYPAAMADANTLVTLARKTGIALIWLSQVANLDRSFGAAGNSMREQLQAGNTWVFQCGQQTANLSVGSKTIEVASIPPVPGASILSSPQHHAPPMLRSWWLEDRVGIVESQVVIPDYDLADVPSATATVIPLGPRMTPPAPAAPAPAPAADVDAAPSAQDGSCLAAVRAVFAATTTGEVTTTGKVLAVTGFSRSRVADAIRVLVEEGVISDGGYGKWVTQ